MRTKLIVGIALVIFTLLTANIIAFGTLPNLFSTKDSKISTTVKKDETSSAFNISNTTQETTNTQTTSSSVQTQTAVQTQTPTQMPAAPMPVQRTRVTRAS